MSPRSRECKCATAIYYFDSRDALVEEVMWWGLADLRRHVAKSSTRPPGDTGMDRIMGGQATCAAELEVSDYDGVDTQYRTDPHPPADTGPQGRKNTDESGHRLIGMRPVRAEIRSDINLFVLRMLLLGS